MIERSTRYLTTELYAVSNIRFASVFGQTVALIRILVLV